MSADNREFTLVMTLLCTQESQHIMSSNTPPSATCGFCSGLYVDPRLLPCLHTFCAKCLKKIVEEEGSGANLKCPTCEKTAILPTRGMDAIQKDIRKSHEADVARLASRMQSEEKESCDLCVNNSTGPATSFCHDCSNFLCETCSSYHKACRVFLDHKLEPLSISKSKSVAADIQHKPVNCQLHENEILKFYCETCNSLICCICMTTEHAGGNHVHRRIEEIFEKEKANLLSIIASTNIDSIKAALDDRIAKGSTLMQEVDNCSQKPIEELIESVFTALTDTLSKRRETLLGKLSSIETDLVAQGEEFQALRSEIVETCEMITTATQTYSPAEMLSVKGAMKKKLEQLKKLYEETYLEPCKSDKISSELDTSALVEDIVSFGLVISGSYPAKAEIDFYMPKAIVGKERKITVMTYDVLGRRFPYGGESMKVTLSWPGHYADGTVIEGRVVDNKDGTYVASFTPQHKHAMCKLSITFNGQHIRGSPFDIYVRDAIDYRMLSLNQISFSFSHQSNSYDVAVTDSGDVFATSYSSGIIEVFDHQGRQIRIIGATGDFLQSKGRGQFHSPTAIAIQGDILYIAEDTNHCIQKLSTSGQLISTFGSKGSEDGQLNKPRGLCLHSDGRVFVSECDNRRISVFDANGEFLYHITGSVADGSNLCEPWGLAFDPNGNLHVADTNNNSIKVFTAQGQYITQYSSVVAQPAGIAIDEEGNIFIAENAIYYNHTSYYNSQYSRLCILNSQYQVLHTLVRCSKCATGITIDKDGSL